MKTAIKLVLIDLVIAQIVAPVLIMIPCTIYLLVTTGNLDKAALNAVYNACPFSHGLGESISMNVPVNFYLN